MIVSKNQHGAIVVSGLVVGYLQTRQYFGHTKQEAIRSFKQEQKNAEKLQKKPNENN